MSTNQKALIEKLNDATRRAFDAAAGLCVARTHYDIEIEHFLLKALDGSDNDIAAILKRYEVDRSRLTAELERSLDLMKRGNASRPNFSPAVMKMLSEAWTVASLDFNAGNIRTGFTLLALLGHDELSRIARDISKELQKIPADSLRSSFYDIVATSSEAQTSLTAADGAKAERGAPADGAAAGMKGKTPHLDQYTVNLTENAKAGKIDPVLGRDQEIRQMIDILMRRRQNNPILTGEAGVGKTAAGIARGSNPQPRSGPLAGGRGSQGRV
jgi:type VI secretion system protein VasG